MAYSSKLNIILVEIPKSGSRTLHNSLMREDSRLTHCGHLTLGQIFQPNIKDNPKVIAVIRDPLERLVSSVNYSTQSHNPKDPYKILDRILDEKVRTHFQTQSRFLEYNNKRTYRLKLFKFEDIDKAVKEFGWDEPAPHHNKSIKKFSMTQLLRYSRLDEFKEYYSKDFKLREKLNV